ncbi:MAG: ATP-dependent zinc metalloprotease FtsH [Lachnospiraceae bacterium]|nr:ATP-dependent zinc metalloprotease FtsH [Lachnospiraceae bacterium]
MTQQKPSISIIIYLIVIVAVFSGYYFFAGNVQKQEAYTYKEFANALAAGSVDSVSIKPNAQGATGEIVVFLKDGSTRQFYVTDVSKVESLLGDYESVDVVVDDIPSDNSLMNSILLIVVAAAVFLIFFAMINRQGGGANAQMMNFGKSRARLTSPLDKAVTFRDVAGLEEEKQDLEEIVDFLREPAKYTAVGARVPKGVILVGPPGTGKTLIAKAVAGEAGVPFFSISGSDFVEMFVGVGASRVRDLFADAKRNHPCIVFIDEIDAVARRRGAGLGGGHDEREQTLNQLLVEMDGFGVNEGIIVLAATNRVDILDPAILRPGRFDRKVDVGLPDVRGREEILRVHAANKPLGDDVDLVQIAQTTAGFSGAELENLLNEAAILAAKNNRVYIVQEDIRRSFVKVGIGAEKRSKVMSQKDKEITAYHESGHAILFHVLPHVGPVYSVSIIPTGMGAAGYTMPLPARDEIFNTRGRMLENIIVSLGGRVAEELVFDDITTGASQDIKQATEVARAMVTKYGMSAKMGLVAYDNDSEEVFIGRDYEKTRSYSERTADEIDEEVRAIIDHCYKEAKRIIDGYREVLDASAKLLLSKEKIGRDEFEALFDGGTISDGERTI